jgi:hypothetical protein
MKTKFLALFLLAASSALAGGRVFVGVGFGGYGYARPAYVVPPAAYVAPGYPYGYPAYPYGYPYAVGPAFYGGYYGGYGYRGYVGRPYVGVRGGYGYGGARGFVGGARGGRR